jgi:hypothetical protein
VTTTSDFKDIVMRPFPSYFYMTTILKIQQANLYSSPSIIRVIKSRKMRWAGHVARMGERRNAYWILVGKSE